MLWTGERAPSAELARRFDVRRLSADELAVLGIEAVPMLVVVDPLGVVRYAGGYTDRKQGPVFRDVEILMMARALMPITGSPVYGCATSERLHSRLALLPVP